MSDQPRTTSGPYRDVAEMLAEIPAKAPPEPWSPWWGIAARVVGASVLFVSVGLLHDLDSQTSYHGVMWTLGAVLLFTGAALLISIVAEFAP